MPLKHPVFARPFPAFTAREWGALVAGAARVVVDRSGLSARIVVVGWSAAGMTALTVTAAARDVGLEVALFVGLTATPPLPGLSPPYTDFLMGSRAANGMAEVAGLLPYFRQSLAVQNALADHEILSDTDYQQSILGNFPVNAMSTPVRYRPDEFVIDMTEATHDMGTFDFWDFPPIGVITHDSSTDEQHSMKDVGQWSVYLVQALYAEYHRLRGAEAVEPSVWEHVRDLVRTAPGRMTREVHGGHMCFLGREGARATAEAVVDLVGESDRQRAELSA